MLDLEAIVAFDCLADGGKNAGRLDRVMRFTADPVDKHGLEGKLSRPVTGSMMLIFRSP